MRPPVRSVNSVPDRRRPAAATRPWAIRNKALQRVLRARGTYQTKARSIWMPCARRAIGDGQRGLEMAGDRARLPVVNVAPIVDQRRHRGRHRGRRERDPKAAVIDELRLAIAVPGDDAPVPFTHGPRVGQIAAQAGDDRLQPRGEAIALVDFFVDFLDTGHSYTCLRQAYLGVHQTASTSHVG
jgi:hypothetical protein